MSADPPSPLRPIPGVEIQPPANPEARRLLASTDWARTPIGPREGWTSSLRSYVDLVMELPTPAIIFWGREQTQIYNDGYAVIMGPRHPRFFGGAYRESWPDTHPLIYPWMRRVLDVGETVAVDRSHITVTRFGFPEEAYFTFTFSPLRDDDGRIQGIFQPVVEVTEQVTAERRSFGLRRLAEQIDALDPDAGPIDSLDTDERDIPFAIVYRWEPASDSLEVVARTANLAGLEGATGPLAAAAREAYDRNGPVEIEAVDEMLGMHAGPWPEPTRRAVAVAMPGFPDRPTGVALFGISPRLHLGPLYRAFLDNVASQLGAAYARVELRRSEQGARAELLVAHEAIRQRTAKLEVANRRKDEFLAMLGHELRNPLGPIQAGAQLLRVDEAPASTRRRAADIIERQTRHLTRIVDDLLDASRVMQGKVELKRNRIELRPIVDQAVEATRGLIETHRQQLRVAVPREGLAVDADETRLVQVVANLLNNASKFTPDGGTIWIESRRDRDRVLLDVRDDGVGIAPELLPDVFEFFVQGRAGLDRAGGGLGIGLTLVRQLVRLHGGDVVVESRGPGQGSLFRVSLPEAVSERREAPFAGPVRDGSGPLLRILIVDDNADMVETATAVLELDGHEVRGALDGAAGIEAAREFRPAVVLCDIGLPGMDGYAVARELRRRLPDARLIALTGYGHDEARRRGQEAGFDHYLVKPVDFKVLTELLRGVRTIPVAEA